MTEGIWIALIGAGGTIVAGLIVRLTLRKPLKEIHLAVNSNLKAMTDKVTTLEATVERLYERLSHE
jgi:fructose-1-phosphate kinase PfkB-like protein